MSFVTSGRNKKFVQAVLSQDAAVIAAQEAEISRRVRGEMQRARLQAEAEGRAQGEAHAVAAMQPELAAVRSAVAALQDGLTQLAAPFARQEQDIAALVIEFSMLLARHIIGAACATDPAPLLALVTKLLVEAGAERGPRQLVRLRLNPADHEYLAKRIAPESATLAADETISQGGAMVEMIVPEGDPLEKTEWDATLEGRFDAIRAALGGAP
jgi:flagellar assembly protein FliH